MRLPLSLLSSKLVRPKALSCSSQDMPSSPFTSFVALLSMHSRTLTLWGPELHTVLKARLHQHKIQRDNHLSRPAGYAVFDAPQAVVCPLGCLGTLLAPIELTTNQHPQTPFCRAALRPLLSQCIPVFGITLSQVQNLAFVLVKCGVKCLSILHSMILSIIFPGTEVRLTCL